jgi:phage host-nuclease inhibitor protein Gam
MAGLGKAGKSWLGWARHGTAGLGCMTISIGGKSMNQAEATVTEPEGRDISRRTDVDSDGWVFDLDSGEVLGRIDADDRFEIDSIERAEWALRLRSELEGELVALDVREAALLRQLRTLRAAKLRRLAWWDYRFAPSLIAFARSLLSGKGRTAQFAWGRVSFRSTKGTTRILDMDAAIDWMKAWNPAKVKIRESVTVKDVLETRKAAAEEYGEWLEHLGFLASSGPGESVKVSTGIEVKAEGTGDISPRSRK